MNIAPKHILAGIGIILAIVAMIWPNNILVAAAVLVLGVSAFVP